MHDIHINNRKKPDLQNDNSSPYKNKECGTQLWGKGSGRPRLRTKLALAHTRRKDQEAPRPKITNGNLESKTKIEKKPYIYKGAPRERESGAGRGLRGPEKASSSVADNPISFLRTAEGDSRTAAHSCAKKLSHTRSNVRKCVEVCVCVCREDSPVVV